MAQPLPSTSAAAGTTPINTTTTSTSTSAATNRPGTRALVHLPASLTVGVPFELQTTLAHAMETGQRRDAQGQLVARSIVTRFEARFNGALVLALDLHPAIAANPYLAFWLQVDGPGTLTLDWTGDHGFAHRETRQLQPTPA